MATIIPATEYLDGSVLDPASHNTNVYSTGTQGVVSTMNGGLDAVNLDPTFTDATSDLILPGQIAQPSVASDNETIQCFGDLFGDETTSHDGVIDRPNQLRAVPGLGKRIYLSYSPSCVMWEWSYFVNPQRWLIRVEAGTTGSGVDKSGLLLIGAKLNGVLIQESIRPLPRTLFHNFTVSAGTGREVTSYVGRGSFSVDMHYLQEAPASGWHSLEVCVYCENLSRSSTLAETSVYIRAQRQDLNDTYRADLTTAAVFGVRNVRATPLY